MDDFGATSASDAANALKSTKKCVCSWGEQCRDWQVVFASGIRAEAKSHVRQSPQSDPHDLLCQLDMHELLHRLYERGGLQKCSQLLHTKWR